MPPTTSTSGDAHLKPSELFGTSRTDTRILLKAMVDYLKTPTLPVKTDLDEEIGLRAAGSIAHKYWTALSNRVVAARATVDLDTSELALLDLEFNTQVPAFNLVLRNRDLRFLDDDSIHALFTHDGAARRRRSSSVTAPGRSTREGASKEKGGGAGKGGPTFTARANMADDDDDDDGEDADNRVRRQLGVQPSHPTLRPRDPVKVSTADRPKHKPTAGGSGSAPRQPPSSGASRSVTQKQSFSTNTSAGDKGYDAGGSGEDDSDGDDDHDEDDSMSAYTSYDEGDADLEDYDSLAVSLLKKVGSAPSSSRRPVSMSVKRTKSIARSLRLKQHKDGVRQAALCASADLPLEVAEAIILDKYVDLCKIHAHNPATVVAVPLADLELGVFIAAPAPTSTIPSAHAWLIAFDKMERLLVQFYDHRKEELDFYRRWWSGQVQQRPNLLSSMVSFDANYRRNLGGDGYGNDLWDATRDSSALFRHFAPSSHSGRYFDDTSSSSSRRPQLYDEPPRTKRRIAFDCPKDVCARYNLGQDHNQTFCNQTEPKRLHVCSDCRKGDHKRGDSACNGGAGGSGCNNLFARATKQ
ncbi:hypothetical protein JCM1840_007627 [Sporobolomyces johnsonii]